MKIILDSGAVALYNQNANTRDTLGTPLKDRSKADYSFFKSDEFIQYREKYIAFVKKYESKLTAYINLDVIGNGEQSYNSLKYMEQNDCHPLPVFHVGTDPTWLKRYIDEGYRYICCAGMYPEKFQTLKPALDKLWYDYLTDDNRHPKIKVHGLAATSHPLLREYKWHSVDSSSSIKSSGYGDIKIPRLKRNRFNFSIPPITVPVSTKTTKNNHLATQPASVQRAIIQWLDDINIDYETVQTDYEVRTKANMIYYARLAEALPYELTLYFAGSAPKGSRPENLFPKKGHIGVMLTYFDVYKNNGNLPASLKCVLKTDPENHTKKRANPVHTKH